MTLSQTPSAKPRKPYTKRASKKAQIIEPIIRKRIIKEEFLGWNKKQTIAYFFERIETIDGEIKDLYVALPDDGKEIYYLEKPKLGQ